MLTLWAGQAESLWDEALPIEVKELAGRSRGAGWGVGGSGVDDGAVGAVASGGRGDRSGGVDRWPADDRDGDLRPVDGAQAAVRWGYRTLVAEVSDSIHLRRFCRIALSERVPDESTVRKLTRRIGAETVSELTRALIVPSDTREAVSAASGSDRLDGDRGRRAATRPTRISLRTGSARSHGRGASSRSWSARSGRGCGIARGRSGVRCGRSPARSVAAPGRRRRRCWR